MLLLELLLELNIGLTMKNNLTQLNVRLSMNLIEELEKFCNNGLMYKQEVVELAIRRFLNAEKSKVKNA